MNKLVLSILFLTLSMGAALAQHTLDVNFSSAVFYTHESGTYIETYMEVEGNQLTYLMQEDSMKQATLEVTMLFKNADAIKEYRKFNVGSPFYPDSVRNYRSFIDLQRITIPEGIYNFDLKVRDKNGPDSLLPYTTSRLMHVDVLPGKLSLSGIQLLDRYQETPFQSIYVKQGHECKPASLGVVPPDVLHLGFYTEIYWAGEAFDLLGDFVVKYAICDAKTAKVVPGSAYFQTETARNVNPIYRSLDISLLPSGNYYLHVQVCDMNEKVKVQKKKFFQRENPGVASKAQPWAKLPASSFVQALPADSLAYFIQSLRPLCDSIDLQFVDQVDPAKSQQFFYDFWLQRSAKPAEAWELYKKRLHALENLVDPGVLPLYQTDKGRVGLQYGLPDAVKKESAETGAYPYEIWHYYVLGDLSHVKFVFCNTSPDQETYTLIHSNMPGEAKRKDWLQQIYFDGHPQQGKALEYFKSN